MPPMTYPDFQQYCARFGFVDTPLTQEEFNHCVDAGLDDEGIYGVACDVLAAIDFDAAVAGNLYQEYDNA